MTDAVSEILSSTARIKVLRTLYEIDRPTSLRRIEALTGLAIRSVQVAVEGLSEERILLERRRGNRVYFKPNKKHVLATVLAELFGVLQTHQLQARSKSYRRRGIEVLKLCDDQWKLMRRACR